MSETSREFPIRAAPYLHQRKAAAFALERLESGGGAALHRLGAKAKYRLLLTGSMKAFAVYVKRLLAKGKKTSGVVTRFSLQKAQNAGGIAYSQAQFAVARLLAAEELPYIAAMAEQVKAFATRVGYEAEAVSAEAVDPETGEILPPLA